MVYSLPLCYVESSVNSSYSKNPFLLFRSYWQCRPFFKLQNSVNEIDYCAVLFHHSAGPFIAAILFG